MKTPATLIREILNHSPIHGPDYDPCLSFKLNRLSTTKLRRLHRLHVPGSTETVPEPWKI